MANPQLLTSITPMSGGVSANAGTGQIIQLAVSGSWTLGDEYTFLFTETASGFQIQVGAGDVVGIVPTYLLTTKKKMNFLAGSVWYFSAIDLPTTFNDINTGGNGFIELANNFSDSENFLALLPFQGRIAVHGRTNWQLWQTASDPADYALVQTLPNIPTIAKLSVLGIGEMDGIFLTDTGVRSLRVINASLNADVTDSGSPIDLLIQELLLTCSDTEKAAACGVREPSTGLYWLFVKNTIYVFAYYPSVKILAWSQWTPSYQTANSATVTNNSLTTGYYIKIGEVNSVTKTTQTFGLNPGQVGINLLPGVYIFAINIATGALVASEAIPGGLEFSGSIAFNGTVFSYTANQTAFTPQKFVIQDGQVFVRTATNIFTYGGAANGTYDNIVPVAEISWLPLDEPGVHKTTFGVDVDMVGTWNMYGSTDYLSGLFQRVFNTINNPTYDLHNVSWTSTGTHVKVRLQGAGTAEKCTISGVIIYTRDNQSKGVNK